MVMPLVRLSALLLAGHGAIAKDFTSITNVPQDVTSVLASVSYECFNPIPQVQFTIEPADSVTVSCTPANLVTASERNGQLEFSWNRTVAVKAGGGGIKVGFPKAKLASVEVMSLYSAQVLDGFTNVTYLRSQGAANLQATLNSLATTVTVEVIATGSSTLIVETNSVVEEASSENSATLAVKASSLTLAKAQGSSTFDINGDVKNAEVSGSATLSIDGTLTGTGSSSGGANLNLGAITGSVTASSASQVRASSCNFVTTTIASSCSQTAEPEISIDVKEEKLTKKGEISCTYNPNTGDDDYQTDTNTAHACLVTPSVLLISIVLAIVA